MMPSHTPMLALAAQAPAGGGSGMTVFLGQIALIFAIFYFLLIRPQQKQRREHEERLRAVKKGDEIVTAGGIVGEVLHIKPVSAEGAVSMEDRITIRSGESKLVVERARIARIVTPTASTPTAAS